VPITKHPFEIGAVYHRKTDIHGPFSGQAQGGVSTPADHPFVFLFTGDSGEAYGYQDGFQLDGLFWYTGEGQVGDMELARGNAAIAYHRDRGRSLLVFEYVERGKVRFVGEAECLGWHEEIRPDRNGTPRKALVFHLAFEAANDGPPPANPDPRAPAGDEINLSHATKAQLRRIALASASESATLQERTRLVALRSQAIKLYALRRAGGKCEGCDSPAPFQTRKGPYLEVHHLLRLADGGPDHPEWVIALCPNCHRRAHYATDARVFNTELRERVVASEASTR
jgi:5-methylcytosine-specific restriction protein A